MIVVPSVPGRALLAQDHQQEQGNEHSKQQGSDRRDQGQTDQQNHGNKQGGDHREQGQANRVNQGQANQQNHSNQQRNDRSDQGQTNQQNQVNQQGSDHREQGQANRMNQGQANQQNHSNQQRNDRQNQAQANHENQGGGYHFRQEDAPRLRQQYSQIDRVDRSRRPRYSAGQRLPEGWNQRIRPVPTSVYGQLAPPPPGYRMGYIDGYAVAYNPTTQIIADVLDLVATATGR
jgi:hypothetical protein